MPTRYPKAPRITLAQRIADQERWIAEHGGTLAGYVARYGSAKAPGHYGDGGEAIWAADHGALLHLRALAERQAKPKAPHTLRNRTGQYDYSLVLVCRCGHTLGEHGDPDVPASRRCCVADEGCDCTGFRAAKAVRK